VSPCGWALGGGKGGWFFVVLDAKTRSLLRCVYGREFYALYCTASRREKRRFRLPLAYSTAGKARLAGSQQPPLPHACTMRRERRRKGGRRRTCLLAGHLRVPLRLPAFSLIRDRDGSLLVTYPGRWFQTRQTVPHDETASLTRYAVRTVTLAVGAFERAAANTFTFACPPPPALLPYGSFLFGFPWRGLHLLFF